RIEDFGGRFLRAGIERRLDLLHQLVEVHEPAVGAIALDQLGEHGDRQVGLAGAGRAEKDQPGLAELPLRVHELLDIALALAERPQQLVLHPGVVVAAVERREPAAPVTLGNPRRPKQPRHPIALPADARPGCAVPAVRRDDPTPPAALRTGTRYAAFDHGSMVARGLR